MDTGVTPVRGTPDTGPFALRGFWRLAGPYWRSREGRGAWLMALGLALATLGHALLQLRLNLWLGDFFNALDAHAGARIWRDLGVFVALALGLMATAAAQIHFKMGLQAGWRRWITQHLVGRWLDHGHAYKLRFQVGQYDNPDYRIAEDVRLVTEATIDFAAGLVNSVLLLVMFLGVLWGLSEMTAIAIAGWTVPVPGYLVVAAVIYALLTTTLTHLFGRRLVALSEELHAHEGDFRYNLVRVRDNAEGIALSRGEADERLSLAQIFDRLIASWRRLVGLQTRLAWLTSGFSVATPVVPLLIAAPQYIAGAISLGGLMQASQAFVQVQLALGFVVDNYSRISDWLAGIHRIVQFDAAIAEIEQGMKDPHIVVRPSEDGGLRFIALTVDSPDGSVVIDNATTAIQPGERVLVTGESGVGKTTLFRAIAGLWPWGSGAIEVPAGRIIFVPHRPYLPPGTLRAVLAYPEPAERFGEAELQTVLARCGLEQYADKLGTEARWHEIMAEGEQQRVAFARLLLQRPAWVLMDEATSDLDDAAEADLMSVFTKELAGTTLVSTGQRQTLAAFHDRTLTLAASENGAHLLRGPLALPAPAAADGPFWRFLRRLTG
jgi:putative ATP-binding cassette transporter